MKYKIDDRVIVYGHRPTEVGINADHYSSYGTMGSVSSIVDDSEIIVNYDDGTSSEVHPKQCRRLVKKARRVYIPEAMLAHAKLIGENLVGSTLPYSDHQGDWIEFREVKKR